ncbi:Rpn family recombination-promoting nuclease/putative transposase [Cardinium endosymbiont of Tipula unca]|uniref:Rpn family recombination-promoting nuclease/putative transposase n=1 Tax=Cardinium endosymbiont of Tipula unca TaxID=3066216 RepID=UPI0030CB4430
MSKDKKVMQPHDMFFKKTFGRKEVMLDFLKYNLPEGIFKKVDQQSLRLTNKSFVHPVGMRGESDLVFQAQIDNEQGYLYFLVEHQSKVDHHMPMRFMEYNLKLMRQHLAENKGSKLPLILNICIYNGQEKYVGHTNLLSMFESPALAKAYMFGDFNLIDLSSASDSSIAKQQKAALASIMLKHGAHRNFSTVLPNNETVILALCRETNDPSYIEDAFFYILMVDKNEDILEILKSFNPKLKELVMSAAEKLRMEGEQLGMQKGEQLGIQKGKMEVAKSLLKSGIPIEIIASSTGLSIAEIKHLT